MPTLNWLNRPAAFDTASQIPYRLLDTVSTHGEVSGTDNLLIQGDNLEALKALLPFYRSRVKCIFIDPPYNTKSAFEHYDDNLEHAQWLTMMLPRLQLLRQLLSEDGSIWVTIDDNEGHYLKVLMDEVFGRGNFVANVVWQKKYAAANDHKTIAPMHDHMFIYQKTSKWQRNMLVRTESKNRQYRFEDALGRFRPDNYTCGKTSGERPNLYYPVIQPLSGEEIWPKKTAVWRYSQDEHQRHVREGLIYWGKDGTGQVPAFKRYLHLLRNEGVVPETIWMHEDVDHTDGARKEAREVLGTLSLADDFLTPKPERLLQRILHIASNAGDLVLDSFLGSGTTAAVAHKMGRRWIGIEMGAHAATHCLPRLQKVLDGEQGGISKAVGWSGGGGFRFARLGETVFTEGGLINPAVRFATLAAFVWQQETGAAYDANVAMQGGVTGTPLIGVHSLPTSTEEDAPRVVSSTAYYLLFNGILGDKRPASGNVLTRDVLAALLQLHKAHAPQGSSAVVYGEACLVGQARLDLAGIRFSQIPYELRVR
jgi:adenine-specific DNA-methyltransferase